ncbi:MAG: hypothetical protein J6K42_06100 [Clostridia bacterium]|nr:hypothetical protein [Clostridia bacterium]
MFLKFTHYIIHYLCFNSTINSVHRNLRSRISPSPDFSVPEFLRPRFLRPRISPSPNFSVPEFLRPQFLRPRISPSPDSPSPLTINRST